MKPDTLVDYEFKRKMVHGLSILVPFVALYSLDLAKLIILLFCAVYFFSELFKIRSKRIWLHRLIEPLQRPEEKLRLAPAPLYLALGVLGAMSLYSWMAAFLAIYQVGFCDVAAAFAGRKWGRTPLPYSPHKTYAGSLAFFLFALIPFLFFLPWTTVLILAVLGTLIESLKFKDWDNFFVPIVVGFVAEILLS